MSKQYDNELSGALFVAKTKKGPNSPDYSGQCQLDNVPYWISGWKKTSRAGEKYLSLAFRPKDEASQSSSGEDFDDDVPF